MAPAIAGTVAVDRAVELAKQINSKMDTEVGGFKLTEDFDVLPLESPEPGFICRITPRGIVVVGAVGIAAYALWTLSKWVKLHYASQPAAIQNTMALNDIAGALGGININPIIKWLIGRV